MLFLLLVPSAVFCQTHPKAHSHNDYEQAIPFKHAFDKGFNSIEADVWLADGKLLVGHDKQDLRPERTLESLYLVPLHKALRQKKNQRKAPLQLLIDIKSDANATLEALTNLLGKWQDRIPADQVIFSISGNRPAIDRYASWPAYIYFDGRPGNKYNPEALAKVSLISDSYGNYLIRGTQTPDTARMRKAVQAAHALGKPFRFWAHPDNPEGWMLMTKIGADFLNTDHIDQLADFMKQLPERLLEDSVQQSTLHTAPVLMPYNRIIRSAGQVVRFGSPAVENHALDICRIEGTDLVAVEDRYGIAVMDVNGTIKDRFTYTDKKELGNIVSTYSGIKSFRYQGKTWIVWSAAGGANARLMYAEWTDKITGIGTLDIERKAPAKNAIPNEIHVSGGEDPHLYIVLNGNDELMKLRWADKRVVWKTSTGVAPYGVTLANGKLYVTNWAGPKVTDSQTDQAGVPWGAAYTAPETGATARGNVSVIDPESGTLIREIETGLHPNAIISSQDQRHIYVSNGNSDNITVIDTRNDKVTETIAVGLFEGQTISGGSSPNGLSLHPDGQTLFVSNGMDNAVAVIKLSGRTGNKNRSRVQGFIPTEAYPAGSLVVGDKLIVANLESEGVNVINPTRKARGVHYQLASVSIIPLPDASTLEAHTQSVLRQALDHRLMNASLPARENIAPVPVPERIGEPSIFKHVVYIIKENKTYDQVFGDMSKGRGDSSLCVFGEKATPNTHALARTFGWMDNYYASGKSSAEGHQWSNAAIVSDYVEKNVRAWFRSYPHRQEDAMVYNKTGYIWNHAMAYGKKVRIFGEACLTVYDKKLKWTELFKHYQSGKPAVWHNETTIAPLRPIISPDFPDNDNLVFSDQQRADVFIREWDRYEAGDSLPHLMIVSLPNDHGAGLSPDFPTPDAMVADNDLALGRIVERITRSKYFDSTVILVTQDDSQSGWDHISGYRTVGMAISQYSTGDVVTTQYNQTSMVRTIEQILGLPPMHSLDATASPMFDCFRNAPVKRSFQALPNNIPLDKMNKPLNALRGKERKYALDSMNELFEEVDGGEDDAMNRIVWYYTKGNKKYPKKR
jgi:YVTN family beta-propeller protein